MNMRRGWVGLPTFILSVIAIGLVCYVSTAPPTRSQTTTPPPASVEPQQQQQFESIIEKWASRYQDAFRQENESLRAKMQAPMRTARSKELCELMGDGKVEGWLGQVIDVYLNFSEDVVFWVRLSERVVLYAIIPKTDPIFGRVAAFKRGEMVRFSGSLMPVKSDQEDCFDQSGSIADPMRWPGYRFHFTRVERIVP